MKLRECSFLIFCIVILFVIPACSSFNPFNNQIQTTSDGAYVVETAMSDSELLSYGQVVVYRFKSVPNMIAVKSLNIGKLNHEFIYNKNIYLLPDKNKKIRGDISENHSSISSNSNCSQAYCEAQFDQVYKSISNNNINLSPIDIAIVDSGVVASTFPIQNALTFSSNISGDTNVRNWSSHATYIASIFTGYVQNNSQFIKDIYAVNAKIHSIKISFSTDNEDPDRKRYGSMQLAVALDEAVFEGAKIVNLSLAYTKKPDDNVEIAEKIVISNAVGKGVIFVCASGNDGNELSLFPVYPAAYNLHNIVSVGSHNSDLSKASSSNYGNSVDITAQGSFIYLNNKNGEVDVVGGTSFSAPIVVAALSLYYGIRPSENINSVLSQLFSSANSYYLSNNGISVSRYGRLDVKSFVNSALVHNN